MAKSARKYTILLTALLLLLAGPARGRGSKRGISLDDAVAMARRNPRVAIAQVQVQEAQSRVQEARGAWYPKIRVLSFVAPSPEIRCLDALCTQTIPKEASVNFSGVFGGFELRLVQPLFTSGKLSNARDAARHGVAMAQAQSEMVADGQTSQVARAFYGVKLSRELISMLGVARADIVDAESQVADKLDRGSPDVELQDQFRLATLRSEVDARLAEAEEGRQTALAGLRALVGDQNVLVESAPMELLDAELATSILPYTRAASSSRPELELARQTKMAAASLLNLEQSNYWPDLLVAGEIKVARAQGVDDVPSAFADDPFNRSTAGLAVILRWEIDPVVQRARAAKMRSRATQANLLARVASDAVRFDVERAFVRAMQAKARWTANRDGASSTRAWIASVMQAQALGLAEAKDLADAYLAHFTVQSRLLKSVFDWNLAVIELRRASGQLGQAQ